MTEKFKIKNCLKFGGFVVSREPDPAQIKAMHEMKQPTTKKEAQSFLGFLNCLKPWLPSISQQTTILRDLSRKGSTFLWTEDTEQEYQKIREAIIQFVTLTAFDPTRKTTLDIDACFDAGCGFALTQLSDENSIRIIQTGSTGIGQAQRNYNCTS